MSTALAIASVTRVLKDLLNDGFVDNDVSGAVGGNVIVTALPPDRISTELDATQTSQVNLFLHQVTLNPGWRNADLPNRDDRGQRVGNPLLPLNLHYLLTAYGAEELHGEILLGYSMLLMHENTVLTREAIRTSLAGATANGNLPPAFRAVAASELAEQVELIRITPENLSTDDMSKLWTAFQTHYRPTAAYQVSVVLMESRRSARSPLPVLTRGRPDPTSGRDAGIAVQASLLPPYPALASLDFPNKQIAARMGEIVTLVGHHLHGDKVFLRFTDPRSQRTLELEALTGSTGALLLVQLPPDPPVGPVDANSPENPGNWRAGAYGVAARIGSAGEADRTTNELPMMLAPRIVSLAYDAAATGFKVTCSPPVGRGQRVSLIVGQREVAADPIAAPLSRELTFPAGDMAPGAYWARLRVDGAESILIDRTASPPAFVASQQVIVR